MITSFILSQLNAAGIKACPSFPAKKPDTPFTVVHRLEQGRLDHIDTITLDFLSYARETYQADNQDDQVKELIFSLSGVHGISRIELGGGGNSEDTTNNLWETESIFNITYYKEVFNDE